MPPAREGRGGRDSAIWLTARRQQQGYTEPMFFVSANTEDFADKKTLKLHLKLQSEIGEGYGPIEFFRSLDALLDQLATKVETTVSSSTVEMLADDLLGGLLAAGALVDFATAEELANAEIRVAEVKVVRAYSVEGVILARCDVTAFVNIQNELDNDSALPPKRVLVCPRCWLEIDEATSSPNAIDVFELIATKPATADPGSA
jgi:hypothetical protein